MRVRQVLAAPVRGGSFTNNQAVVGSGRGRDGVTCAGPPPTSAVRAHAYIHAPSTGPEIHQRSVL